MSERAHKRKRSLQDSSVDLSKMRMALNRIDALKEELDGIEETEEELRSVLDHVSALEGILKGPKKPRLTFSTVSAEDLKRAGIMRRRLVFDSAKLAEMTNALTTKERTEIAELHSRIKRIYASVNMDYEPGSRILLDAILLWLAEVSSNQSKGVAILPGMRIAPGDGVQITHPVSGYELWLSGNVDYAVIEYEKVKDYKDRLLRGGSSDDVFEVAKGRLFLVEAKRQGLEQTLVSYIPEAVSQAIALLKSAKLPEVRFCLSDGHTWIFFVLKQEDNVLTYYESAIRRLSRGGLEHSDLELCEIVQLVRDWLSPAATGLFVLE